MICITQNPTIKVTIKAYKADALVTPQFDVWENLVKGIRIYFHWNNWIKLEKLVHPTPSLLALKQCSSGSSLVVQTFLVIVHHSDTFFGWQTLTIPNIHEIVFFFQTFFFCLMVGNDKQINWGKLIVTKLEERSLALSKFILPLNI